MTKEEYLKMKDALDDKYREDMAALERTWTLFNGSQAPATVVRNGDDELRGVHSPMSLGIVTSRNNQGIEPVSKRGRREGPRGHYKHSAGWLAAHRPDEK